jgi:hypothetical protein
MGLDSGWSFVTRRYAAGLHSTTYRGNLMRARTATLLALSLVAVPGVTGPASAAPPAADSCDITVTGYRVPHQNVGLALTAEVDTVVATVTCRLDGLLTTPPIDDVPYQGDLQVGVFTDSAYCEAGSTTFAIPSAGPTLVLAATGQCTFDASEPAGVVHTPIALLITSPLVGSGDYSQVEREGSFVN